MPDEVHIVIGAGIVLAAYVGEQGRLFAQLHAKTISGATVLTVDMLHELPGNVRDDLALDMEWQDDDLDTPVVEARHGDELDR